MQNTLMANQMQVVNSTYFLLLSNAPIQFATSAFCIGICLPQFCTHTMSDTKMVSRIEIRRCIAWMCVIFWQHRSQWENHLWQIE